MEELEPIFETDKASFFVELMKRINMQREQDYFCDITLVANDGKEFKAHRNVLSAASPFFDRLLQSEMKENKEGVVRFKDLSASRLEDVLEFVYTGNVEVNDEQNAKDLIIATDYLLLECLKSFPERFLEQRVTISNCISTFYFAEKYHCAELVSISRKFVLENFASVAEMDEFLNLEAKEVESWISSDEICVAAEEDVFKIIEKWVEQNKSERKAKFEELFRHVRLVLVSRDFLLDVVTNEFVRESLCCFQKISDAIELSPSEDTLSQSPRRRLETQAIVACGGKYTLCYLPEQNKWKRLVDGLTESRAENTQMITFRDQLYTFTGGSNAERYDPIFNGWASSQCLRLSHTKLVAIVRGQMYAIDVDKNTKKSTVERYDEGLWSWQTIFSSHEVCREDSCVVAAGNCLYVLGGRPVEEWRSVAKTERFDTVKNNWEEITDLRQERCLAFGVATQGKIFVAGGKGTNGDGLKTCEVYNISTNEWQFIGSLNTPRVYGSMVCLNGTLYVLGGKMFTVIFGGCSSSCYEYTVESYDPTVNEWTQKTTIPVVTSHRKANPTFKGCALKLPKAVLDKVQTIYSLKLI